MTIAKRLEYPRILSASIAILLLAGGLGAQSRYLGELDGQHTVPFDYTRSGRCTFVDRVRDDRPLTFDPGTFDIFPPGAFSCQPFRFRDGRAEVNHPDIPVIVELADPTVAPTVVNLSEPRDVSAGIALVGRATFREGGDDHAIRIGVEVGLDPATGKARDQLTCSRQAAFVSSSATSRLIVADALCGVSVMDVVADSATMADVGGVMTVTEFSAEVVSEFYIVMDHGSADDGKTIRRGARLIYTVKSRYRFQLADNILKIAEAIPDNKIPLDAGSVQTFTPIVTYQLISADSGSIKLNLFDKDGMLIASSPEKKISRDDGKVDFPFDCTDNLCLKDIMLPDEDPLFLSAQMFDDTGVELLQSADIIYTFGGPDLTVSHIEVVQVTQTVDNKMPLVRNKQTLVRVYPGLADDSPAADPALKVTVALEGFAGAAPLPGSPRPPTAPWTRAKPVKRPGGAKPTMAERRRPNSSINFVLPTAWTQQRITLRAIVDPAGMVVGDKEKNNALDLPANFQRTNNLSVGYMRFSVPPAAGAAPLTPSNRVADAGAWVQRVYPVRDGGLAYFELTAAPIPWTPIMQGVASLADGRARLHRTLTRIYNLVERTLFLDQIVGYLDNSIQIYAAGNQGDSNPLWVDGAGRSAIAIEQFGPNNRGALLGHELGHNMGLRHTNVMGKLCFAMSDSPWMTKFTDNGIQDIGWELGAPGAPAQGSSALPCPLAT